MSQYIFVVGKPSLGDAITQAVHQQGYQLGLLRDIRVKIKHPEKFDIVIDIDFSNLETEIARIDTSLISIAGLLCTYENYVVAKAIIADKLAVPAGTVESARLCTDKLLMRQAFHNTNPAITPAFARVNTLEDALIFARTTTYPLFLKPTNLVKSLLVLKCEDEQELTSNFAYASQHMSALYEKYHVDHKPQLILEEGIRGDSYSVAAFVDHTGRPHFCDGIVAITSASQRGVHDNYLYERRLPATLPTDAQKLLFDVAADGVKALRMRSTPAHIELMYDGTTCKIIEIGARIGGYRPRMYTLSYGLDLTVQEVNLALGVAPDLRGTFQAYSAVYELFPEREGTFAGIKGDVPELTSMYTYYRTTVQTGDLIGPAKNGYKAAVIVIVSHTNKAVFETLRSSVDKLKIVTS